MMISTSGRGPCGLCEILVFRVKHVAVMVQVEVDDYRDYDKALAALSEAYNILDKSPAADDTYHAAVTELRIRMTLIKAYLDAVEYVTMWHIQSGPEKIAQSLMHHNFATVFSRITWFSRGDTVGDHSYTRILFQRSDILLHFQTRAAQR